MICLKNVLEQGTSEQEAAEYIREHVDKPVVGYVVGISAPPGKTMGHAGAIISGGVGLQRRRSRRWRVREWRWQGVLRMLLGRLKTCFKVRSGFQHLSYNLLCFLYYLCHEPIILFFTESFLEGIDI